MEVVCGAHMEGWLYLIQTTRLMMTQPRQRYFMLVGSRALYYKEKPAHRDEVQFTENLQENLSRDSSYLLRFIRILKDRTILEHTWW
jgi:hypothetical protein